MERLQKITVDDGVAITPPNKNLNSDGGDVYRIRVTTSRLGSSWSPKSNTRCKRSSAVRRLWIPMAFLTLMATATMLTFRHSVFRYSVYLDSVRYSLFDYQSTPLSAYKLNDTTTGGIACVDEKNSENCTGQASCQLSENVTDCDYDCLRLRCQLMRWPEEKPKAFIYFLIICDRLDQMLNSLALLDKYFNDKYQYPVVIFHETEASIDVARTTLRSSTNATLYFQTVNFQIPDFLPRNLTQRSCHWSLGYRHMCRFHAKLIYEQPIIRGFEYAWRLDDDSEILQPIDYDVFEYMRQNDLQYCYSIVREDAPECVVNLWENATLYIRQNRINTTFFETWKKYAVFYNNFEISRLSLWLSRDYQDFMDYIDRLGGIYYHRWGDAPIKTIAVSMFLHMNETHHFKDISYRHQRYRN